MSEIQNVGRKGYCLMYFLIFLFLFIVLIIWIYNRNQSGVPVIGG